MESLLIRPPRQIQMKYLSKGNEVKIFDLLVRSGIIFILTGKLAFLILVMKDNKVISYLLWLKPGRKLEGKGPGTKNKYSYHRGGC